MAIGRKTKTVKKTSGKGYKVSDKTKLNTKTSNTVNKYKVKNKVTGGKQKEKTVNKYGASVTKSVTKSPNSKRTKKYYVNSKNGNTKVISKKTYKSVRRSK